MHILIAVDGSSGSREALRTVAATPFPASTRVTLLHVVTRYVPAEPAMAAHTLDTLRAEEDRRAQAVVDEARSILAPRGFDLEVRSVEGHPAQQIVESAAALGTDLVVMGALGVTGWMRVLLGSVSLTVVKHSPCPVWVVKRPMKAGPPDVLIASDGSANARHAIEVLSGLPLPRETVCHLLYVVPAANEQLHLGMGEPVPPVLDSLYRMGEAQREHGQRVLKEDAAALGKRFADVRPFMLEGDPRRHILDAAGEVEADLIVMGSKGLSGIREFFLGSISHKVLKHAEASILVVPHP